jgi:20S proteasome alpha/beta subunit
MLLGQYTRPILRIGTKTLIGCFGLQSDIFKLKNDLRGKLSDCLDEEMEPENISHILSSYLYTSGLYISPILVGYGKNGPYVCSMDSLGASTVSNSFAAIGTANAGLLAICEALYEPELTAEELVSLTKKTLNMVRYI